MSPVDPERVRTLLGEIGQARTKMRELADVDEETFVEDYRHHDAVKYQFVVAIESAIDVCNHVVAALGSRAPEDYADCFTVLAELGVVSDDLARRLRAMARFRNLLVHRYGHVDDREVYRILQNDAADLDEFREEVARWTTEEGPAGG